MQMQVDNLLGKLVEIDTLSMTASKEDPNFDAYTGLAGKLTMMTID